MANNKNGRGGLGRGLSALMADVNTQTPVDQTNDRPARPDNMVPIEAVKPNPHQPRRQFDTGALEELSASIKEKGVLQPLIVRPIGDGTFEIVAGERRWRAAQMAQLHEIPVLVRDLSDTEVLEIAIIENIQRADLNPVEEASGYRQLMDSFGHTQEKLAEALGKSRSYIANLLRLLSLPPEVLEHLREGRLSAGHARALITADDPAGLARIVIQKGLSVRETEALVKRGGAPATSSTPKPSRKPEKDADTRALEADLSANLGMDVRVDMSGKGESGSLTIQYDDLDQLDALCRVLSASPLDVSR